MDKFATRTPVNKTAAMVTSKGYSFKSKKKICTADQSNPIPTRPVLSGEDFSGKRRGRLTVIGLAHKRGKWVVRCDCGVYTLRNAKAINNEENDQDRCEECRHMAYLKRNHIKRTTGKDVNIEEF